MSVYPNNGSLFVVEDVRKPFAIMKRSNGLNPLSRPFSYPVDHPLHGYAFSASPDWMPARPPVIITANEAFCSLFKYSVDELIGRHPSHIFVPQERLRKLVEPYVKGKFSQGVSPIILIKPYCVNRNGELMRVLSKHQIFYDESGELLWGVVYIESVVKKTTKTQLKVSPVMTIPLDPPGWIKKASDVSGSGSGSGSGTNGVLSFYSRNGEYGDNL
jgi:hypothetical protein